MATIYRKNNFFDENFSRVEDDKAKDLEGKPHLIQKVQFTRNFGKQTKDIVLHYEIVDKDLTIFIEKKIFDELKRQGATDVNEIINGVKKKYGEQKHAKLKVPSLKKFRDLLIAASCILAVATVGTGFMMTNEKNFEGQTKTYTENESVNLGDFVEANLIYIDAYQVSITTTTTNYGVKTNETTQAGNMYVLATTAFDSPGTYIFRYNQTNPRYQDLQKFIDSGEDIEFGKIEGEVKKLDKIESLDQSEQILPYFLKSINTFNSTYAQESLSFDEPIYLIDGRVTKGSLSSVIFVIVSLAVLTLVSLCSSILLHKKINLWIRTEVKDILSKNSSVIQKS